MFEFLNLAQNASIFLIVGIVLFVIGFLMSGNAKKNNVAGVFSMLFKTIGIILALIAISYWVTTSLTNWSEVSDRML